MSGIVELVVLFFKSGIFYSFSIIFSLIIFVCIFTFFGSFLLVNAQCSALVLALFFFFVIFLNLCCYFIILSIIFTFIFSFFKFLETYLVYMCLYLSSDCSFAIEQYSCFTDVKVSWILLQIYLREFCLFVLNYDFLELSIFLEFHVLFVVILVIHSVVYTLLQKA